MVAIGILMEKGVTSTVSPAIFLSREITPDLEHGYVGHIIITYCYNNKTVGPTCASCDGYIAKQLINNMYLMIENQCKSPK